MISKVHNCLILVFWWGVVIGFARDGARDIEKAQATLTVRTNIPGVEIFIDTVSLGVTPLPTTTIDTGRHIFRFIHPQTRSWLYPAMIETVVVQPSEHLERTIIFPTMYHITSEPYGAEVFVTDRLVGHTPYFLAATSTKEIIRIRKEGYEDVTIPLSPAETEVHALLRALSPTNPDQISPYLSNERSKNTFPIYLTTSATVVTGVAAAYFKIKADKYYNDYRKTGDLRTLDKVHRLDTISGVSLVASELSLFMLTYLLFSR